MKVVMICGVARSGTSLACGLMDILGVPFHQTEFYAGQEKFNPKGHFEDYDLIPVMQPVQREFAPYVIAGKCPPASRIAYWTEHTRERIMAIARRQQKLGWWGFKCQSLMALDVFCRLFNDLHIICTTRTLVHQAKSYQNLVEQHPKTPRSMTFHTALKEVADANWAMVHSLARNCDVPAYFLPFEEIRGSAIFHARTIAEQLGLPFEEHHRKRILQFVDKDFRSW